MTFGSVDVTQRNAAICTPQPSALSRVSRSVVTSGTWCTIQRRRGDVELLVHRLVGLDHLREPGQVLDAVLVAPAGLGDQALRLAPDGAAGERRRPLADRAGHQHVVAEELELIAEALLQLRQRRVGLVLQEVHLQANERPSLAMQRQPRVVHPVLIEVGQNLIRMQRSGSGEEHFVEMRGQAEARGVGHRVERAALLVVEGLHAPQMKERAGRRSAAREARSAR